MGLNIEILNKSWVKLSHLHGRVSDMKIITLICLELQDSIYDTNILKDKIEQYDGKINLLNEEIDIKNKKIKDNFEIIKKFELELNANNKEKIKIENSLEDLHDELKQIKNNLLKDKNEVRPKELLHKLNSVFFSKF